MEGLDAKMALQRSSNRLLFMSTFSNNAINCRMSWYGGSDRHAPSQTGHCDDANSDASAKSTEIELDRCEELVELTAHTDQQKPGHRPIWKVGTKGQSQPLQVQKIQDHHMA